MLSPVYLNNEWKTYPLVNISSEGPPVAASNPTHLPARWVAPARLGVSFSPFWVSNSCFPAQCCHQIAVQKPHLCKYGAKRHLKRCLFMALFQAIHGLKPKIYDHFTWERKLAGCVHRNSSMWLSLQPQHHGGRSASFAWLDICHDWNFIENAGWKSLKQLQQPGIWQMSCSALQAQTQ